MQTPPFPPQASPLWDCFEHGHTRIGKSQPKPPLPPTGSPNPRAEGLAVVPSGTCPLLGPCWLQRTQVCRHIPATEASLHRRCLAQGALAHASHPTHTCPPRTRPSPPRSRKLPGSQTAWQMLLGLAPTQAHAHTAGCQPFCARRGWRSPRRSQALLGQSLAGTCPNSCCTQGRMSPEGKQAVGEEP